MRSRVVTIVALCCLVQMLLWAVATFWILPAAQNSQRGVLPPSSRHDDDGHHDDRHNADNADAAPSVKRTRGGSIRSGIVVNTKGTSKHVTSGGKKKPTRRPKATHAAGDKDDHHKPLRHHEEAPPPPSTTKCVKRKGRGCGVNNDNLLDAPFFDLFDNTTISDLANMERDEFLRTAFRSIEFKPLAQQKRPKHLVNVAGANGDEQKQAVTTGSSSRQQPSSPSSYAKLAYALIISNEDFVDGAMVLGASLLANSPLLRSGQAELVLIVTENRIGRDSKRRLNEVGFTVIASVPSLARFVPGAALKDTFDKIFMFALVMFERVVFMDADMLNVKSADELFERRFIPQKLHHQQQQDREQQMLEEERWVGAIGFRDGREGDYFQTGMIVFRPSMRTFARVLNRFARNIPPRGRLYNLGMNGRDGVLIRDVFGSNFTEFSNKYSRNLNPRNHIPDDVVSLHFRGRHKMWYDRRWPNADPETGKKEFGFNYVAWWEMYERLHKNSEDYALAVRQSSSSAGGDAAERDALGNPYGGKDAAPGVSAKTHVWMMRHTRREYVQLLHDVEAQQLELTLPGLKLMAGDFGQSCDAVCSAKSLSCVPRALNWTHINSCAVLQKFFGGCEDGCEMGVYWRQHPGREFPGFDVRKITPPQNKKGKKRSGKMCIFNYRHDERCFPTCGAFNETTRRLCPCAPAAQAGDDVAPVRGVPEMEY